MSPSNNLCALGLLSLLSGCAVGLAEASAEPCGCRSAEEVAVTDVHTPFPGEGGAQWTATCRGIRHFCHQAGDRTICTPDPRPPPGRAAAHEARDRPATQASMSARMASVRSERGTESPEDPTRPRRAPHLH